MQRALQGLGNQIRAIPNFDTGRRQGTQQVHYRDTRRRRLRHGRGEKRRKQWSGKPGAALFDFD